MVLRCFEILVKFPKMKNRGAKIADVQKELHDQLLLRRDNVKLCAVTAYQRQISLLPNPDDRKAPFARSANVHTKKPGPKGAGYATYRGVAEWVRGELGRALVFKDLARRPVTTHLANALGTTDAAKALGIREKTVARYHRSGGDLMRWAAEVVRQVWESVWKPGLWHFTPFRQNVSSCRRGT